MSTTVNAQPQQVMRRASHKSVIGILRDAIEAWQKSIFQNRDYVADEVVKAHHAIGAVERTGIWIEPETPGRPESLRLKANADRIHRWLDDASKDTNLLPANFLPSVLAGLPPDWRVDAINQILEPAGLIARSLDAPFAEDVSPLECLKSLLKEGGEAQQSLITMATSGSRADALDAIREVDDLINAATATRDSITARLAVKEG